MIAEFAEVDGTGKLITICDIMTVLFIPTRAVQAGAGAI